MRTTLVALAAAGAVAAALLATPAAAQVALSPPENVVTLTASAAAELPNDLLTVVLGTRREGPDAAEVQAQLKQALDAALGQARRVAVPRQIELRTGNFSLQPRHLPQGGTSGWVGTAELIVEGRDVAGIAQLAGRLPTLTVEQASWSLSREAREQAEGEVSAQAITAFRAHADRVAKAFGFSSWHLREVNLGSDTPRPYGAPRMAMAARSGADEAAPLPVEAGLATVSVQVSGSVQLAK
ncbi:MAG: SIMPL domain-containing protein [Rubrivivax sp.]